MKYLFLILFAISGSYAFAKPCEVYGISDSPQKLTCNFKSQSVNLSCVKGIYYLNNVKVQNAFHYEVEEGPVPLVFEATSSKLVVLVHTKSNIEAEFESSGKTFFGRCK